MDTSNLKLCVICCSAFSSASIVASDAALCREHLVSFCKLLANSPPKQTPELEELVQKCFPGMDEFFVESGMSVCTDCHHQITLAMQKGTDAEKKEEEVRKLQKQILEKMKELQKQLDEFHDEMTKVEKTIQMSDVSCLMYHMAQNPSKNENATNGIVSIRDRILNVMADLRDFQSRQNNTLNFDVDSFLQKLLGGSNDPAEDNQDDDEYLPFIAPPEVVIGTEGLIEAGINPMFFGHTIFGNDGDYRFEANEKVNKVDEDGGNDTDYSVGADGGDESEDSDVLEEPLPMVGHQISIPKQYEGGSFEVKKQIAALNNILAPEVHLQTEFNSSSPPSLLKSDFKTKVIERALRRKEARDPKLDSNLDPLIRFTILYDKQRDKLTFNQYEIRINQVTRALECAQCGHSCRELATKTGNIDIEWRIKAHIMSVHAGFFCLDPACRFIPKYSSHHHLLRHIRDKHLIPSLQKNSKNMLNCANKVLNAGTSNNNKTPTKPPPREGTRKSTRHKSPPPEAPKPKPQPPKPSTSKAKNSSSSQIQKGASVGRGPIKCPRPPTVPAPSPPKQRSSVPSTSTAKVARMCPVSACRKMFTEKEEFIKHLQDHRQQNHRDRDRLLQMKYARTPNKVSSANTDPEIVTLD